MDRGTKSNVKQIISLCMPLVLSQMGQVLVSLSDNIMVGKAGAKYLAAASFANGIFILIFCLGIGFTFGLTPLVGKSYGADEKSNLIRLLQNGNLLNIIVAITLAVFASVIGFLMPYMGQEEIIIRYAQPYFYIQAISIIPMILFLSLKQFAEGMSNTRFAMVIIVTANIVNIGLNYIFIYGKLGSPAMMLNGAGYATLISRTLMFVMIYVMFRRDKVFGKFPLAYKRRYISRSSIKKIFNIGNTIGWQMVIECSLFSLGAIMVGWIDETVQAAHQIAATVSFITFMIANAVAQATTIRISYLLGRNRVRDIKSTIAIAYGMVSTVMLICGVSFYLLKDTFPRMFVTEIEVIEIASSLMIFVAIFQIFQGAQVIGIGILRAFGDVKIPMRMTIVSYFCVGLVTSYIFGFGFNFGIKGIWFGFIAGLISASTLFLYRIRANIKTLEKEIVS